MKSAVDRLENELRGKLMVRRVDIQSAEGHKLANQYGIELTPTFILFNAGGREQWRSVGALDAARLRISLQPFGREG
jgi:hypothetical protein